jgi:hypothetical protein
MGFGSGWRSGSGRNPLEGCRSIDVNQLNCDANPKRLNQFQAGPTRARDGPQRARLVRSGSCTRYARNVYSLLVQHVGTETVWLPVQLERGARPDHAAAHAEHNDVFGTRAQLLFDRRA